MHLVKSLNLSMSLSHVRRAPLRDASPQIPHAAHSPSSPTSTLPPSLSLSHSIFTSLLFASTLLFVYLWPRKKKNVDCN